MKNTVIFKPVILLCALFLFIGKNVAQNTSGIFEGNNDIGNVNHKGSLEFSPSDSTYTISGSGTNMWYNTDEFHFVWKKMSGNVSLGATIEMLGEGVDPHRKACLMIRQSLEPDAPYVDIAVHGDGLTSMQYRTMKGAETNEIKSNVLAPKHIQIEKVGNYISMQIADENNDLQLAGGS